MCRPLHDGVLLLSWLSPPPDFSGGEVSTLTGWEVKIPSLDASGHFCSWGGGVRFHSLARTHFEWQVGRVRCMRTLSTKTHSTTRCLNVTGSVVDGVLQSVFNL